MTDLASDLKGGVVIEPGAQIQQQNLARGLMRPDDFIVVFDQDIGISAGQVGGMTLLPADESVQVSKITVKPFIETQGLAKISGVNGEVLFVGDFEPADPLNRR